jgi:alpha-tubulin suppressor-like RCC1 family protein
MGKSMFFNALRAWFLSLMVCFLNLGCTLESRIYSLNKDSSSVAIPIVEKIAAPTSLSVSYPSRNKGVILNPIINVGGLTAGSTVKLYSDSQCTSLVSSAITENSDVNIPIPNSLADGEYSFYATQSDSKETSACSLVSAKYILDTVFSTVSFASNYREDIEGNLSRSIVVSITPTKPFDVVLSYSTVGSTAVSGVNYSGLSALGTVTILANQSSASINYSLLENALVEGDKYLEIGLLEVGAASYKFSDSILFRQYILDNDVTYSNVTAISSRCAIVVPGTLKCWGNNALGMVGDNTTTNRSMAVIVDAGTNYSSVVADTNGTTCGITSGGNLKCWGSNTFGAVGVGTATANYTTPQLVDGATLYSKVSHGGLTGCGITSTGVLKCWGNSYAGQTGSGNTTYLTSPTIIDGGTNYIDVSAGQTTCGVTSSGALKCWGVGSGGAVGDGGVTQRNTPVSVDGGTLYSKVSVGIFHGCAITQAGAMKCWGFNSNGQLGDGTTTQRDTPVLIDSGVSYTRVFTGVVNTCGITTTNVLKCWGRNNVGQLGDGSSINRLTPTIIQPGIIYSEIAMSDTLTCGRTGGIMRCWGLNANFQMATELAYETLPVIVDPGIVYSSFANGGNSVTAITKDGSLKSWGSASLFFSQSHLIGGGDWGDGTSGVRPFPLPLDILKTFKKADAFDNICTIDSEGDLRCMGAENIYGILADPAVVSAPLFIPIDLGVKYSDISVGNNHMCGITQAGQLKCWGRNAGFGSVGNGTVVNRTTPDIIDPGVNYSKISAKGHTTCGVTSVGVLKCWGFNFNGQLGDGTNSIKSSPIIIDVGVSYSDVVVGSSNHTCGITTAGDLKCWGSNSSGQLGDSSLIDRWTPTAIDAGTKYSSVYLGSAFTCGITMAGVLKCWGGNLSGQLGDGSTISKSSPVVIDAGVSYSKVGGSASSACGITSAGVLKCWGFNIYGQVGNGKSGILPTRPGGVQY